MSLSSLIPNVDISFKCLILLSLTLLLGATFEDGGQESAKSRYGRDFLGGLPMFVDSASLWQITGFLAGLVKVYLYLRNIWKALAISLDVKFISSEFITTWKENRRLKCRWHIRCTYAYTVTCCSFYGATKVVMYSIWDFYIALVFSMAQSRALCCYSCLLFNMFNKKICHVFNILNRNDSGIRYIHSLHAIQELSVPRFIFSDNIGWAVQLKYDADSI